jgi:hypothetical protein
MVFLSQKFNDSAFTHQTDKAWMLQQFVALSDL